MSGFDESERNWFYLWIKLTIIISILTEFIEEEVEEDEHGAHEHDEDEDENRGNPERNFFGRMTNTFFVTDSLFVVVT